MREIILDARELVEKEPAHIYLAEMFEFPDYYGRNLDALYDCLTEEGNYYIVVEHAEEADGYYEALKYLFMEASEEDDSIIFEER